MVDEVVEGHVGHGENMRLRRRGLRSLPFIGKAYRSRYMAEGLTFPVVGHSRNVLRKGFG